MQSSDFGGERHARVLCTSPLHPRAVEQLRAVAAVHVASDTSAETLAREAGDADVVIVRDPLPSGIFARAPRVRAAIRHGAGLDMVPVEEATAAGVLVANVPGVNAQSVAEHVILVTLMLARQVRLVDTDLRRDGWHAGRAHGLNGHELHGRTLGLVGTGNVGRAVARVAGRGFDMRVLGHGRRPDRTPEGVEYRPLDRLLAESDVVVLACPLTDATRGLLDARRLVLMKPEALLVNVSRGAVIEDDALLEALTLGSIGGAALDVFAQQPLPADHPFFGLGNVVLTPHVAGTTTDSMEAMGVGAATAAQAVLAGKIPHNVVNKAVLESRPGAADGGPMIPEALEAKHE